MVKEFERARLLHVANGTSTTRTIQAAGIPGAVSIWADPLYEGPVPAGLNDDQLVTVRARYLSRAGTAQDVANSLESWRRVIDSYESYDELILWFEHDLFDQLNLVQLLSWLRRRLPNRKRVTLVCIDAFPGRATFKGLGELTPPELASLLPTRRPVSDAVYNLAERAWHALRAPTPEPLDDLRRQDTAALPFLSAALTRFLQEYPSTTDGLSRTECRLLQLFEAAPADIRASFPRMHDGERAYYITDLTFVALLDDLSQCRPALIRLDTTQKPGGLVMPKGTATLTDTGRAVLDGHLDKVATCGIDRWLGGVHLQAGGDDWRWDEERQQVTKGH